MVEFIGKSEMELQHQRACGIIGCINALDDPRGCGHGPKCEACTLRLAMINTLHTGESHRGVRVIKIFDRPSGEKIDGLGGA